MLVLRGHGQMLRKVGKVVFGDSEKKKFAYRVDSCEWLEVTFNAESPSGKIIQMTLSGKFVRLLTIPEILDLQRTSKDPSLRRFPANGFGVPKNPLKEITDTITTTKIIPDNFLPHGIIRFETDTVAYIKFYEGFPTYSSSGISSIPMITNALGSFYSPHIFNARHYYARHRLSDYYHTIDKNLKTLRYNGRKFESRRTGNIYDGNGFVTSVGIFDDKDRLVDGYTYANEIFKGEHPAISGTGVSIYIDGIKTPNLRISDFYHHITKFDAKKELDKDLATKHFEEKLECMHKKRKPLFKNPPGYSDSFVSSNMLYEEPKAKPNSIDNQMSLFARHGNATRFVLVRERH